MSEEGESGSSLVTKAHLFPVSAVSLSWLNQINFNAFGTCKVPNLTARYSLPTLFQLRNGLAQ